jgi:PhoPQ-activated pathogenicity-related protein
MRYVVRLTAVVCFVALCAGTRADLKSFMARPEPAFKWEKTGEETIDGVTVYDLHMVSQVWQGHTWEHKVQIFRPEKLEYPNHCLIYNTGGNGSRGNTEMGVKLAKLSGATYAIVHGNPKQPLYDGKTEDALIVYTWQKYFTTGDDTWPLHLPMAKSVLKGMDTVQAFAKQQNWAHIDGFIVNGASKRGWTTWLVGASQDPRVKAIAPMVIDVLNVIKQVKHQVEQWGKVSEQIGDYSQGGLMQIIDTPAFAKLMEYQDPYSYRDVLTMPKLLVLGTNDRYWAQDALNIYWDDLKGPKWVLYTPNSGHSLEDRERVYNTLAAFTRMVAGGKSFPRMMWNYTEEDSSVKLRLVSTVPPKSARLFHVTSSTLDFRNEKWTSDELSTSGLNISAAQKRPEAGYNAVFGEATYDLDGRPFTLSTQVRIVAPKKLSR